MICEENNISAFFLSSSLSSESSIDSSIQIEFQDIQVVKLLNKAKFSVLLVRCPQTNLLSAMKLFPLHRGNTIDHYQNEIRFSHLSHKNIISVFHHDSHRVLRQKDGLIKASCIFMEYAPYGDFFDLLTTHKVRFDNKLLRTYFHQLIAGLEYLHSIGIAHLDIKLENLLLGKGFQLKITDFDFSFCKGDSQIRGSGTRFYRGPELINGNCTDPQAADIFSAGIVLFVLKSGSILPQCEKHLYQGRNLFELLQTNNAEFWEFHEKLMGKGSYYEEDFRALFNGMTKADPRQRMSIADIKNSKWFNQEIYDDEELAREMKKRLSMQFPHC